MIANLLVFAIVALMAMWFANQGLFSAVLHLFLTIIAGTLAFGVWEPITVKFILGFLPEYAWAIGLLVPFALALFLLRLLVDKYVPGNLNFHNLANSIGGGAVGAINGALTAGILIIGLQFVANFDLLGYHPYQLSPAGQFERAQRLWIPADNMAAGLFTSISSGSMGAGNSIQNMHGDLLEAASAFQAVPRQYARLAVKPAAVNLTRMIVLDEAADVPAEVRHGAGQQTFVVSTSIQVSGTPDAAGDSDGTFTASKAQVALLASSPDGVSHVHYPVGFVVNEAYAQFTAGDFARSDPSVGGENIDWLFSVPTDQTPTYFRIKNLRLELQGAPASAPQVAEYVKGVTWKQPETPTTPPPVPDQPPPSDMGPPPTGQQPPALPPPPTTPPPTTPPPSTTPTDLGATRSGGAGAAAEGLNIVISDDLPATLSSNWLSTAATNVQLEANALLSADGMIQFVPTERVMANLAISRIAHPAGTQIVQVQMREARARSMLGQAYQIAAQTQAPMLNSATGDDYYAIGYSIHRHGVIELHLNPDNMIRAMSQVNTNMMQPDDTLILYFRVGSGAQITEFKIGNASRQAIDPPLQVQ